MRVKIINKENNNLLETSYDVFNIKEQRDSFIIEFFDSKGAVQKETYSRDEYYLISDSLILFKFKEVSDD